MSVAFSTTRRTARSSSATRSTVAEAVRQVHGRRQSAILRRLPTMIVRPTQRPSKNASVPVVISSEDSGKVSETATDANVAHDSPTGYLSEPDEMDEVVPQDDDDSSLLLNDYSFDEMISPQMQSTALQLMGRNLTSRQRLINGRWDPQRPWLSGFARCPTYSGNTIQKPRVRPARTSSAQPVKQVQRHPYHRPVKVSVVSKLPYLVWPLNTQMIKKDSATGNTRHPPSAIPFPKGIFESSRAYIASLPPTEPFKADMHVACKPNRGDKEKEDSFKESLSPVVCKVGNGSETLQSHDKIVQQPSSIETSTVVASSDLTAKDASKHVRFAEDAVDLIYFAGEDTVAQTCCTHDEDGQSLEWSPISAHRKCTRESASKGMAHIFEYTVNGPTMRRQFLQRYASVQRAEQQRKEESVAMGKHQELGQLDYGNTDYRIALQASGVITADDIGIRQDPSAIGTYGIPKSTYDPANGPLVVFGAFKGFFENAVIPPKPAKPAKQPLRIPSLMLGVSWARFQQQHLSRLQPADDGE
ncbi:hypothetical protein ACN47E_000639 [Coniothyrium glycines]